VRELELGLSLSAATGAANTEVRIAHEAKRAKRVMAHSPCGTIEVEVEQSANASQSVRCVATLTQPTSSMSYLGVWVLVRKCASTLAAFRQLGYQTWTRRLAGAGCEGLQTLLPA
jgi:hypothetical protein